VSANITQIKSYNHNNQPFAVNAQGKLAAACEKSGDKQALRKMQGSTELFGFRKISYA